MTEPKRATPSRWKWVLAALAGGALWFSPVFERVRTEHDDDFIPWDLTGFVVWFQESGASDQRELGTVPANYEGRKLGLLECQERARFQARRLQVEPGWSYVCCTQTPQSSCKTKVK